MCGIVGFVEMSPLPEADATALVLDMAGSLRHRGPDDAGVWLDRDAGLALGHRRLSIIDLSPAGHQPMGSRDGRHVLSFNGEIYNFRELRERLLALGHTFRGDSDTEVLLAGVAEWGVQRAITFARGMFAFAVWDRHERVLTLARDRLGEKPLYYGWVGSAFVFASELKAFRKHPSWAPVVDRAALTLYLRHNYVPAPYSIYEGIRKLPPGCMLQFSGGEAGALPSPQAYWSPSRAMGNSTESKPRSDEESVDELEELLRRAVQEQMVADVPLGAFLSGGIDSSTVVALMQAQSSRPVKTFTIGVPDKKRDEAAAARAVAQHLGTDHTELYVTPEDALAMVPRLSHIYDEPFADSSQVPTCLISQLTRQSVTVSLSGDGGDELFAGYEHYARGPRLQQQLGWCPAMARRQIGRMLQSRAVATCLQPWSRRDGGTLADRAVRLGEVLVEESPLAVHRALLTNWTQPAAIVRGGWEPATEFTSSGSAAPERTLSENMLLTDAATYLPDDLLVKVDRAAMAVGLETRVPLLDHRVVEFALGLPWHLKVRGGQRKWILRQVLYRHVPRHLVDRPKQGFGVPMGDWLRGPLRTWAEELLDPIRIDTEGFFHSAPIRRRWKQHLSGRADWSYPLWTLLMFQSWVCGEIQTPAQ